MGLFKRRRMSPVSELMAAAGLPTAGGEIPMPDLAMEVARKDNRRIQACLDVAEKLLSTDGADSDASLTALSFLETLQNATSHGTPELFTHAQLFPLYGPHTAAAWEQVDRFWRGVVSWCDENGVELESAQGLHAVTNPKLRSILWPTSRSLPDGRRVGLSHVLRFEKATGVSMTDAGHPPVGTL